MKCPKCNTSNESDAYFCHICAIKLRTRINGWAICSAILFVGSVILAYFVYDNCEKQSADIQTLTDSTQIHTNDDTTTIKESDINDRHIINITHGATVAGGNIINTGSNNTQNNEPVKPLKSAEKPEQKARTVQTERPVKQTAEQTKQTLEQADAAFQEGIKEGYSGYFEKAYQLYLKSDKEAGYKKFKERADKFQREGLNAEYEKFINYANRLK